MDYAIAFMDILGIRDIAVHVIALVEVIRRISAFILNFIGICGDLLINGFMITVTSSTYALDQVILMYHCISQEISTFIQQVTERLIYTAHTLSIPPIYMYKTVTSFYQTVCDLSIAAAQNVSFCFNAVVEFIAFWYISICQFISSWCTNAINLCLKVTTICGSTTEYIKQCLISVGDTVWVLATMIPLSVVYISSMSIYLVGRCCEEVSSIFWLLLEGSIALLNKTIFYWSDMPLQSALGLIIGTISVIIVVKFGYPCLKGVISLMERAWNIVFNSHPIRGLPVAPVAAAVAVAPEPAAVAVAAVTPEKTEEILCVICQDRARQVVSFPCRHLCMCRECSANLAERREPCPICRRRVVRTVTVYT